MSQQFYDKFLSFFLGFTILFTLLSATAQFLLVYVLFQNQLLYIAYLTSLVCTGMFGTCYYWDSKDFKANLNLFLPNPQADDEVEPEPLSLNDDEERPLKVCLCYEQGSGFIQIRDQLGLNHANTVRRELRKGLRFLLTFYNEHKQEVKT